MKNLRTQTKPSSKSKCLTLRQNIGPRGGISHNQLHFKGLESERNKSGNLKDAPPIEKREIHKEEMVFLRFHKRKEERNDRSWRKKTNMPTSLLISTIPSIKETKMKYTEKTKGKLLSSKYKNKKKFSNQATIKWKEKI